MILNKRIKQIGGFLILLNLGTNAWANEPPKLNLDYTDSLQRFKTLDLRLPTPGIVSNSFNLQNSPVYSRNSLLLAQASGETKTNEDSFHEKYEDRIFTSNKTHKYLGIGAIAAGVIAALAPKEEDGLHENSAKTSALLAVGAVATGLTYHWEDISAEGGFSDPDNLHALLAGLGALGIAIAASEGPESGHETAGMLGLTAMLIGVKYTW